LHRQHPTKVISPNRAGEKFEIAKRQSSHDDAGRMNQIRKVLDFGRIYLRRYWGRLVGGILMGVLFGMSNASFI